MADIDVVAQALRVAESDDDYRRQQLVSVGGERYRKVGAYGILDKRWTELAEAAGYAGADWRDPTAQDNIAKQKLRQDYETFGSWEAAVVAFRFGAQAAKAHVESVDHPARAEVDSYLSNVKRRMGNEDRKVIGKVVTSEPEKNPNLSRAQKIVRDKLVMMRDMQQRGGTDGSGNEELVEDGNQDVPGGVEQGGGEPSADSGRTVGTEHTEGARQVNG